jgi:hypothetical protein
MAVRVNSDFYTALGTLPLVMRGICLLLVRGPEFKWDLREGGSNDERGANVCRVAGAERVEEHEALGVAIRILGKRHGATTWY